MAQELATSVELLAAAIQAIPFDRLGQSDAKRLAIAIERPLEILRQTSTSPLPRSDRRRPRVALLPKPARVRSVVDWISASTRSRAAVRPDLL